MTISRRGFIGGVAAGAGALAGSAQAASTQHFSGYPGRYGLLHDTTLCVGCRSCEAACNKVNDLPAPEEAFDNMAVLDETRRTTDKALTVVNRYKDAEGDDPAVYRKLQCMHCNEPTCASVCFVNAFTKTPEGPVVYNPDVCVGCRYCVMACPYYALSYEYDEPLTPRVMRCTMCYPRIKEGKQPGCADACPMGAITFGKREDLIKVARERIRKEPGRYIDHLFGEHEFGGTSWLMLAGVSFGQLDLPEGATHTPIPELSSGFLSMVPLVVTIVPGLLAGFHSFTQRKEKLAEDARAEAVAQTVAAAEEETKKKLDAAAQKADKTKDQAVKTAVKKALAEAETKKEDA